MRGMLKRYPVFFMSLGALLYLWFLASLQSCSYDVSFCGYNSLADTWRGFVAILALCGVLGIMGFMAWQCRSR